MDSQKFHERKMAYHEIMETLPPSHIPSDVCCTYFFPNLTDLGSVKRQPFKPKIKENLANFCCQVDKTLPLQKLFALLLDRCQHSVWILNSEETCQALFMVFFGRITSHLKNNRARSMNGHEGTR